MSKYSCSLCDYTSKTKWNVKNHINKTCTGAVLEEELIKVKCEVCNKEFDTEKSLKTHKATCIPKRALVEISYANPIEMQEKYDILTSVVKTLIDKCGTLEDENKHLMKRIEKLEKTNKNSKDGYEDLTENEVIYDCEFREDETYEPLSFDIVLKEKFKDSKRTPAQFSLPNIQINNSEEMFNGIVSSTSITVNDVP